MYTILLPFWWYIQERNSIKDTINSDLNQAKIELEAKVIEHDQYVIDNNIDLESNDPEAIDNLSLHHALDHIESADTQPQQKQSAIEALDEL